jgi:hypothetical protein
MPRQIMVLCACGAFRVEMQRAGKKMPLDNLWPFRFKKHKKLEPK